MPDKTSQNHFLYDDMAVESYRRLRIHVSNSTKEIWGERPNKPVSLMKWSEGKGMMGSAYGIVYPGWLCLELIWVEPRYRAQGVGAELLREMECEAMRLQAHSAYLWTQDYEAPGFYRHHGYQEFVRLKEFVQGHQLIGMQKKLIAG